MVNVYTLYCSLSKWLLLTSKMLNYMHLDYLKTTKQVAEMLGYTPRNIAFLVKAKKLNPIKVLDNGTFLFNTKDVEFFISNKQKK